MAAAFFGVAEIVWSILSAAIAFFRTPGGQAVLEAADRLVRVAEPMFPHGAARIDFVLHAIMNDIPGTIESDARLAIETALKAFKTATPAP
jgi:hypothetical protein